MRPPQDEIRPGVIEHADVEADDVSIATFVIRVTRRAFIVARIGMPPVKPLPGCDVHPNCGVAVNAKRIMALLLRLHVTVSTVVLDVGVSFGERARHDEGLQSERARLGRSGGENEQRDQ